MNIKMNQLVILKIYITTKNIMVIFNYDKLSINDNETRQY